MYVHLSSLPMTKRKTPLQTAMLNAMDLSRMSGLPVETVRAVLYGKRRPRPETRRKLAAALRQHSETLSTLADSLDP